MSTAATVERVLGHRVLVERIAPRWALDPVLVLAIIAHESGGNPCAIRVERGFWTRYSSGVIALIKESANRLDDPWLAYPDLVSASYGLMQIMYPVALERGAVLEYPTELCDPECGLTWGCAQFRWCLDRMSQEIGAGLLRYNGGANPGYADDVIQWQWNIQDALNTCA